MGSEGNTGTGEWEVQNIRYKRGSKKKKKKERLKDILYNTENRVNIL